MDKLLKRTLNIIFVAALAFAMNLVVFAQGTTMISVSKSAPAVGDSITVSITASESGTITVKYTSSLLQYDSCSVSGASAQGNSVSFSGKSGDIVFKTASAGTASIIVSSSSCSGSSTTLKIGGDASAATQTAPAAQETPAATVEEETEPEVVEETETTEQPVEVTATASTSSVGTLNSNGGFDIDGVSYVVSERYTDAEMPSGFEKKTVKIGSSTYSEPTNGVITLLYLKPADNTQGSGVFYLYDEAAGTVSNFLMLGDAKNYVLVQAVSESPAAGFSQVTSNVGGKEISGFKNGESEFLYVYGTNQSQVEGWFVYDETYGTISRVDASLFSATAVTETEDVNTSASDNTVYVEKLALYRKIIMGLIVFCVILIFITINRLIKNHGDDDDEDFDGDVFAKAPTRPSRRLPRSIVFNNSDDEEDDDDFEDEEEYDDDDEYYDEEDDEDEGSYEEKRNSSLNMMDLNDL